MAQKVFFYIVAELGENFTRGVAHKIGFWGKSGNLAWCHYFNGSQGKLSSPLSTMNRLFPNRLVKGRTLVLNEINIKCFRLVFKTL